MLRNLTHLSCDPGTTAKVNCYSNATVFINNDAAVVFLWLQNAASSFSFRSDSCYAMSRTVLLHNIKACVFQMTRKKSHVRSSSWHTSTLGKKPNVFAYVQQRLLVQLTMRGSRACFIGDDVFLRAARSRRPT